jgi:hypothetical protein
VALSVSAPIRIAALVGLLLAVGLGGSMRLMGGGADSATAVVPAQNSAIVHAKSVAARASARAKHAAAAAATPRHKTPATHKTAAAKPKLKPAPAQAAVKPSRSARRLSAALAAGLPVALAQSLAINPTVVAVVYNPQAEVDGIAVAEARAGAALAGAGFVGLNVLSQAEVGKLTEQLGLLPDPAVLVFTRPAHLAARIDGFADKETVAQAAQNAARGS